MCRELHYENFLNRIIYDVEGFPFSSPSQVLSGEDAGNQSFKSSHYMLEPPLLTWFNFNPNMDK